MDIMHFYRESECSICAQFPTILINIIILFVYIHEPVSHFSLISSLLFSRFLGIISRVPNITGITVTFIYHNLFSYLTKFWCLSSFSLSFIFSPWSDGMAKAARWQVLSSESIKIWFGLLARIECSVYISKSQRRLFISFSRTDSGLYICHLSVRLNILLLNSQWITFPTQSCLLLYSFCGSLQYLLIMWLTVSFPSPHSRHFLVY